MEKTCDYCEAKGPAYTFMNGETICSGCLAMLGADPRELRQKLFKALKEHDRLTSLCANYREALEKIGQIEPRFLNQQEMFDTARAALQAEKEGETP